MKDTTKYAWGVVAAAITAGISTFLLIYFALRAIP